MRIKKRKLVSTMTALSLLFNNIGIISLSTTVRADSKNTPEVNKALISENLDYQYHNTYNYNVIDNVNIDGQTMNIVVDSDEEILNENVEVNEEIVNEDGTEYPLNITGELPLDFTSVDQMIGFYSDVFQVREDIASDIINNQIDQNYDAFYENNTLNGVEYNSREEAVLRTVRDIYSNPDNYNLTREEIHTDEYTLGDYYPEELIYKFSHVLGVNPYIALSVAYSEAGRGLNSFNFQTNYNVAGLHPRRGYTRPTNRNGYIIYQNPADGLCDYCVILHDYFYVTENDGIDRINTMSRSYSEVPGHWRGLVSSNYYNLINNGYDSVYTSNNPDREFVYSLILENE